ncbi:MAG: CHAT domain-containing protein [Proteobacteria bacterium]|nr:CHAT domain-containing protein [Pseudomonadota bacterium]
MAGIRAWLAAAVTVAVLATLPAWAQTPPAAKPPAQPPAREVELGRQADALQRDARYADAVVAATELLKLREARLGPDHPDVAWPVMRLGELRRIQGRYAEAESLFKRALAIRETKLGRDHPDVAHSLVLLALVDIPLGRYAEGEVFARRSLAIREAKFGRDSPAVASASNVTGLLLRAQGRNAEAEPLFRRALAIYEAHRGPDDVELGHVLNNLGSHYAAVGRNADAEAHYKRAVAIHEKALGADHPDLANTLSNLGNFEVQRGRYKDAEPLLQRALAIRERTLGPEHPAVATTLNVLAECYRYQKRLAEAEPLQRRALAIREKVFGPDHPTVADSFNNVALLERALGRPEAAEAAYKRAIAIDEAAFGPDAFSVINTRTNLARLYADAKRYDSALEQSRLATDGAVRYRQSEAAQRGAGVESERGRYRSFFFLHIWLAYKLGEEKPGQRTALAAEAFEQAQLIYASKASQAIAGMAARFAVGDDPLAAVVRERQDLTERWRRLDGAIVAAASKPPAERDQAADKAARAEHASAGQRLAALDAKIAQDFPGYAELSSPRPVKLADLQKMLGADEALLAYASSTTTTWLWAVRRDRAAFYNIDMTSKALRGEVAVLRGKLDPTRNPELKAFDVKRAYALHQSVLAPAAPLLDGVRHVFIVPDGALQSLPIGVLVTAPPADKIDYRKVAWLARQYAVTTLPSVSSLRALRQLAQGGHAPAPFLGIGDPALGGKPGGARGAAGADGDDDVLRQLAPLPDTADELRALAQSLGAGPDTLYLRERASEATIKALKLDQYRVLAFATHGLVAGEIEGLAEPALVLTPPGTTSADDDGLLKASEIARLKLNADWVILSACNTASGETPGAEGLSGLAKAFFYAGSRALLVSHWPVASQAAVRLTTGALDALKREPEIGRAEALRRAQIALLEDKSIGRSGHPMMWAPFVIVGEGAPGH